MRYDYFDFRIRENGINWDKTPVRTILLDDDLEAVKVYAQFMANLFQEEVRMNRSGMKQGYYFETKAFLTTQIRIKKVSQ